MDVKQSYSPGEGGDTPLYGLYIEDITRWLKDMNFMF